MDIWWTLHLKRDPASVPLARRILLGAMDSAGVHPQDAFDLGLALTEACANAVEHAGPGQFGDTFQVTAALSGDRLRIEVANTGAAPGPPAAPRPGPRRRPAPRPTAPRPTGPRRTAAPGAAAPPSPPGCWPPAAPPPTGPRPTTPTCCPRCAPPSRPPTPACCPT
nr:ATP-binding protein [Kitasatospora griseola]